MSEQVTTEAQVTAKTETQDAPAQTPPPATIENKEAPKKDDNLSARFAALAKKERMIMDQTKRLKEMEERLKASEERVKKFEELNDPLEALKAKGWTYEDLTKRILNDNKPTPEEEVRGVRSEVERLRKELEEKERLSLEAQKQKTEEEAAQQVARFKESISDHIKQNAEKFELTSKYEMTEQVYQIIFDNFEKTQKLMTIDEAVNQMEAQLQKEAEEFMGTKYFQTMIAKFNEKQAQSQKQPDSKPTTNQTQFGQKTLTNQVNSSAPSMLPPKTENDRLQRALAALSR